MCIILHMHMIIYVIIYPVFWPSTGIFYDLLGTFSEPQAAKGTSKEISLRHASTRVLSLLSCMWSNTGKQVPYPISV